jgi:hypothetical protein
MSHRNIEEVFRAIAPARRRGIPPSAPIEVGVAGSGGSDTAASMSQAAQEIARLRAQYQNQAALIAANTQALLGNTSSHANQSIGGAIGSATSGFLGGGLGFLSPILSGVLKLFGGGSSPAPPPLPYYTPPANVMMDETLRAATPSTGSSGAGISSGSVTPTPANAVQQITVHVNAMDSQSFMDRSSDIASAVREAMLNLHPINDVVANL